MLAVIFIEAMLPQELTSPDLTASTNSLTVTFSAERERQRERERERKPKE